MKASRERVHPRSTEYKSEELQDTIYLGQMVRGEVPIFYDQHREPEVTEHNKYIDCVWYTTRIAYVDLLRITCKHAQGEAWRSVR